MSKFCFGVVALAISFLGSTHAENMPQNNEIKLAEEVIRLRIESLPVDDAFREKLVNALRVNNRIVNGRPANIADFPWQVALIDATFSEPSRYQFCGGSLINAEWVLTAAHCVASFPINKTAGYVDVVAGTHAYRIGGERLSVSEIYVHPDYNQNSYDFALLKLSQPSLLGKPVALIDQGWSEQNDSSLVSGWGATVENGHGSEILLFAKVPLVANNVCNQPDSYDGRIDDSMICAGYQSGGTDSCQGDSGGPLVLEEESRQQVGVVSWGWGCARKLRYGVYSRVSEALPWIDQHVDRSSVAMNAGPTTDNQPLQRSESRD